MIAPPSLVPAYFGPWESTLWDCVVADAPAMVIINPDTGPGTDPHAGYAEIVARLRAADTSVLGYVTTSWGRKPLSDCGDEAERHRRFYGVDGVFWDEIAIERGTARLASRLAMLAHGGTTVFNTGRAVPQRLLRRLPDALWVTFEGTAEAYAERQRVETRQGGSELLHRQCHLVHSCDPLPAFLPGLGAAYATRDALPNPWDFYERMSASADAAGRASLRER